MADAPRLTLLGYWRGPGAERWPDPRDFVDEQWDPDERDMVVSYLRWGTLVWACMGYSPCRICGRNNGDLELSDGVFLWPNGLAHYVQDHAVKPPQEFIEHALTRAERLEFSERDESWWLSFAGSSPTIGQTTPRR